MSEPVRVFNPDQFEVVIDHVGHSLGGNSAIEVVPDALTESLIASGRLLDRPKAVFPAPVVPEPPVTARKGKRTTNTVTNGSETGE